MKPFVCNSPQIYSDSLEYVGEYVAPLLRTQHECDVTSLHNVLLLVMCYLSL